ncbi:MAG: glycosyltransferase family 9 protein [Candidatus Omnitrophota bacterium]
MEKILFIRLRRLGDIIFTIPSILLFQNHFPSTRLYYVVEEQFQEIADLIPGIHHRIVIPHPMGLRQMWHFKKKMATMDFQTVVDFHSGPKSAQLTFLTRAPIRIGYRTPNRNWAYNRFIPRNSAENPMHSVYSQAQLLKHLSIPIDPEMIPDYPTLSIDETRVQDAVKHALQTSTNRKAVIHMGAGNHFRDWGITNFSALIQNLIKNDWTVFLIGNAPDEREKGKTMSHHYPVPEVRDFTGRLTIPETVYLISHATVYVGADSGPLHLASLTATPLVALYGPNLPEISGPWRRKNVSIVRRSMNCQPCAQRKCIYSDIRCMKTIKMDEIYETIIQYI